MAKTVVYGAQNANRLVKILQGKDLINEKTCQVLLLTNGLKAGGVKEESALYLMLKLLALMFFFNDLDLTVLFHFAFTISLSDAHLPFDVNFR